MATAEARQRNANRLTFLCMASTGAVLALLAFGATGSEFLAWKEKLEGHGLNLRVTDHTMAYSLYFTDPFGNLHEITTYERDYVASQLG